MRGLKEDVKCWESMRRRLRRDWGQRQLRQWTRPQALSVMRTWLWTLVWHFYNSIKTLWCGYILALVSSQPHLPPLRSLRLHTPVADKDRHKLHSRMPIFPLSLVACPHSCSENTIRLLLVTTFSLTHPLCVTLNLRQIPNERRKGGFTTRGLKEC